MSKMQSPVSGPAWMRTDFLFENGSVEAQATQIIRRCGISAKLRGYEYLRAAILVAMRQPVSVGSITKNIYPSVAAQFGTTAACVERSIRTALDDAWKYGDIDALLAFSRRSVQDPLHRPSNGEFIALAADTLRLNAAQSARSASAG